MGSSRSTIVGKPIKEMHTLYCGEEENVLNREDDSFRVNYTLAFPLPLRRSIATLNKIQSSNIRLAPLSVMAYQLKTAKLV